MVTTQSRVADFRKARVALLFHVGFRDKEVRAGVEAALAGLYPGVEFVDRAVLGDIHGRDEAAVIAALPAKLREYGIDAAICGMGC
jgi:hypothetical protein